MADYCTVAEIKADNPESGFNSSSGYDTALGGFITDASRAIDREMGRWDDFFYPSSDTTTRYFDGNGSPELWIDEAVSITSVSVSEEGGLASSDYTLWGSSDYIAWPYNATPTLRLIVDRHNGSKLSFDRYRKAVKIVGIFGYSTTPPQIVKRACKTQAIRWFMRAKQAWQNNGANADVGMVTINYGQKTVDTSTLDPEVSQMLHNIKIGLEGA